MVEEEEEVGSQGMVVVADIQTDDKIIKKVNLSVLGDLVTCRS